MRLAIVGPVAPWRGGIALHGGEMARAARARGHKVLSLSYRRQYPAALFPGRSQLLPGAPPPSPEDPDAPALLDSLDPLSWRRAARAVAAFRPDLVVLQRWHPFFQPALAVVAAGARRAGARVAWMVHNVEPHEGGAWPWRLIATRGMRPEDIYLTHAASEARRLVERGVRGRCLVLLHPWPETAARRADPAEARRALGLGEDEVVFLFFGYVRRYKGVDVLLEALARLTADGPSWRAIVAGEWYIDRAAADAAIARPPLAGRVELVDRYVTDEEAARLFAAATAVVLPYRSGTQSGVVPLAYAHGRGVVSTRVGGLPEAVREGSTGLLVAPEDAAALAQALEQVRRGRRFDPAALDAALAGAGWSGFIAALEGLAGAA